MRLFYALTFSYETRKQLATLQQQLAPTLLKGRPTAFDNLHLTMHFLGEQDESMLPIFSSVLSSLKLQVNTVRFSHIDVFNKQGGAIMYAAIMRNIRLTALHQSLVCQLKLHDIPVNDTRFKAHVTLFRQAQYTVFEDFEPFTGNVESLCLMHSHQVNGTLCYTPIVSNFLS